MDTCYLCGKPIDSARVSGDHVVPSALINRAQPRAKGFDYGGRLPTHEECNNRFGPEIYVRKAFDLLAILEDPEATLVGQHKDAPDVTVKALDASKLPGFSKRDLEFFKIIDVRELDTKIWSSPDFFSDKKKTNLKRDALFVALSVLAKSAAALLVKRKLSSVPQWWRIFAVPYWGGDQKVDFDSLMGTTEPFDVGLKVWAYSAGGDTWFIAFKARQILLFFVFSFSVADPQGDILKIFNDEDVHKFEGASLNDLLTVGWEKVGT